jgi:hypothetical protein
MVGLCVETVNRDRNFFVLKYLCANEECNSRYCIKMESCIVRIQLHIVIIT